MEKYVCPMHPEVISDRPGSCPKCAMDLVLASKVNNSEALPQSKLKVYQPLLIVIGLIVLPALLISLKSSQNLTAFWKDFMLNFMAGFFLVFSGFKLLDLKGFAQGYSTYDLLARKFPQYGLIYPFLELFLGLAYLIRLQPSLVSIFTIVLMGFSGIGVLESLAKKRKFQCACLGTIIKVPLTSITLIEDFGMVLMAILALLTG